MAPAAARFGSDSLLIFSRGSRFTNPRRDVVLCCPWSDRRSLAATVRAGGYRVRQPPSALHHGDTKSDAENCSTGAPRYSELLIRSCNPSSCTGPELLGRLLWSVFKSPSRRPQNAINECGLSPGPVVVPGSRIDSGGHQVISSKQAPRTAFTAAATSHRSTAPSLLVDFPRLLWLSTYGKFACG